MAFWITAAGIGRDYIDRSRPDPCWRRRVVAATDIDEQAVLDDVPKAEAIVEAAAKALPHLTPFTM